MPIKIEISDVTNMNHVERTLLRFILGESEKIEAVRGGVSVEMQNGSSVEFVRDGDDRIVGVGAAPADWSQVQPEAPPAPPTPPAAAPTTHTGGAAVDSRGLPWDARIHGSTKAKIANGEWRTKRGVDPAEVTRVEAELRAAIASVATVATQGESVPPTTFTPAQVVESAVPPPPPSATDTPAPSAPSVTFQDFMGRLTPLLKDRKITEAQVKEIIAKYDVAHMGIFLTVPDTQRHLPAVEADIMALVAEGGVAV